MMMYSDFLKAIGVSEYMVTEKRDTRRSLDKCQHKHLDEIHYVLATTAKGDVRSYTAFCCDCNNMVYAQTGGIRVPWTVNRDAAFTNGYEEKK
jgi:hypothetical protein